jgi:hypothetical protein
VAEIEQQGEGVGALFGRLVDDGKAFARAEIGYYRTLAAIKAGQAKGGLILIVAAVLIASACVTALLVGLILSLATLVGPGLATLIVIVGALVLAGLLGWLGVRSLQRGFGGDA